MSDLSIRKRRDAREDAKTAMIVTMAAVTATGWVLLGRKRRDTGGIRMAHIATGVALLGASWWHHALYPKTRR